MVLRCRTKEQKFDGKSSDLNRLPVKIFKHVTASRYIGSFRRRAHLRNYTTNQSTNQKRNAKYTNVVELTRNPDSNFLLKMCKAKGYEIRVKKRSLHKARFATRTLADDLTKNDAKERRR